MIDFLGLIFTLVIISLFAVFYGDKKVSNCGCVVLAFMSLSIALVLLTIIAEKDAPPQTHKTASHSEYKPHDTIKPTPLRKDFDDISSDCYGSGYLQGIEMGRKDGEINRKGLRYSLTIPPNIKNEKAYMEGFYDGYENGFNSGGRRYIKESEEIEKKAHPYSNHPIYGYPISSKGGKGYRGTSGYEHSSGIHAK